MSGPIALEALDLAALLCSRVCHDLISPVGAIINGLEVMEDDKDEETKTFAHGPDQEERADRPRRKLQFCRLAFGAAGSAGAQIDIGDAEKVTRGLLEDEKTKITWNLPRRAAAEEPREAPAQHAADRRPGHSARRHSSRSIRSAKARPWGSEITATGTNAKRAAGGAGPARGRAGRPCVDAHAIQPFYTGLLARNCGLTVAIALEGEAIVLRRAPITLGSAGFRSVNGVANARR